MNDDGSPKIAGIVLHNLMAILSDPGANATTFSPGALNFSLSGMPPASGSFLIEKSNGAFQLILWNETPIWDMPTGAQINFPSNKVTISLPSGSSGSVYDPTKGPTSVSGFSNVSQLDVSLNDSPLIIEVQDPGKASASGGAALTRVGRSKAAPTAPFAHLYRANGDSKAAENG
jgi:hypothetical protein